MDPKSLLKLGVFLIVLTGFPLSLLFALAGHSLLINLADDAFFFYRYALHFSSELRFSWLADGPAEYGATSQFYQLIIWFCHSLFMSLDELVLPLTSMIFGLFTFVALMAIAAGTAPLGTQRWLIAVVALGLAGLQSKIFDHFFSGMETTLSTALVSAFVLTLVISASDRRLAVACLFVPLIYFARPEAALIPAFTSIAILLSLKPKEWFRANIVCWISLGTSLVIAQWILYWIVYRTPLPIPFYIKSLNTPYSSEALNTYSFGNLDEFYQLFRSNSIQIALCVFTIAIGFTKPYRLSAWQWGLAVGTLAFLLFCLVGNRVPVTSGGARFLVPAIPVIVYFSAKAAYLLSSAKGYEGILVGRAFILVGLVCAATVQTPPMLSALARGIVLPALRCQFTCWGPAARGEALRANLKSQGKWEALLAVVDFLPTECSLADTEVGAIGAFPWQRRLLDYSGLNYLELAQKRNAAQRLLADTPDFVYLDRISWYWSITPVERINLIETFTPLSALPGRDTLYVRRGSECRRHVQTQQ